jgi:predicted permease
VTIHPLSVMAAARGRVRALFQRRSVEGELSDEIRFHLEMETEKNIRAGMTPDEARRAAALAFGGVERVREEHRDARGTRLFENLASDFKYAARTLRKNPGFTTVVALTIMLGIGANAAVFSVAYGVLLRPLPYAESERLVRLWSRNDARQLPYFSVSPADFADWRARNRVFTAMAAYERQRSVTLTRGNEPQALEVASVSPAVFSVLGTPALFGRSLTDDDARPGAPLVGVMEHDLWMTRFGRDSSIVGSDVIIDGQKVAIVGVMPQYFFLPGNPAQLWLPLSLANASPDHGNRYLRVVGRLRPGVALADANAQMDRIAAQVAAENPGANPDWRVNMMSINEQVIGRQWRRSVIVLSGVVAFVLLIACANAANLQLARGAARRKEIAVRTAIGAGRGRIVAQLLAESTVLAIIGGAAGLALAFFGVSVLRSVGADRIPRIAEVEINGIVLAFTALITLLSGFLFGILPAFAASRSDVSTVLKEGGRGTSREGIGQRARGALVMAQVALSLVLLVGAGLLIKSFVQLQDVQLGFDPQDVHLATVRLPEARYAEPDRFGDFYGTLLERVRQARGVRSAALISSAPFAGPNNGFAFIVPERPPRPGEGSPAADARVITDGYFRSMRIGMLRGRDFTPADRRGAPNVVIISETMAKQHWPDTDPVGRQLHMGAREKPMPFTIVGVVRDVRYQSLQDPEVRPLMYFSAFAGPPRGMAIVAQASDATTFTSQAREALRAIDATLPFAMVDSMERLVTQALATQRFALVLFAIFAATALLLAAIGIYGVLSYLVRQRTHEMGVRVALGASSSALMRDVLVGAMRLTLPGVLIGIAGAWWLTGLMSTLLFNVSPKDTLTFATVAVVLTATAALASLAPARRATRADPMLALRSD